MILFVLVLAFLFSFLYNFFLSFSYLTSKYINNKKQPQRSRQLLPLSAGFFADCFAAICNSRESFDFLLHPLHTFATFLPTPEYFVSIKKKPGFAPSSSSSSSSVRSSAESLEDEESLVRLVRPFSDPSVPVGVGALGRVHSFDDGKFVQVCTKI